MSSYLETITVAALAFAATNIDDFVVLTLFFSNSRYRPYTVVAGQYIGISILVIASIVLAAIFVHLAPSFTQVLGIFPVVIGLRDFIRLRRDRNAPAGQLSPGHGVLSGILSVAVVTIANGGDNIAIYTPLFAKYPPNIAALIVVVFAVFTGVWCLIAHSIIYRTRIGQLLQAGARKGAPFVLILLGLFITLK
jgi:cadmium resistance protein CadD (predicted permease)